MNKKIKYLFALLLLFSVLAGCKEKEISKQPSNEPGSPPDGKTPVSEEQEEVIFKLPINFDTDGDHRIIGFIDDETIIYTTHFRDYSIIQSYDLITGEQEEVYTSSEIIGQVVMNEQLTNILVISYPSSYEAKFTYITTEGKVINQMSYQAFDFEVHWNPYNEDEVLVTSFFEDWTFKSEVVNIQENSSKEVITTQPFMYWASKNKLAFIDYMDDVWSMTGKLIVQGIDDEKEKELMDKVYYIDSALNQIFVITLEDDTSGIAKYKIINDKFEEVSSNEVIKLSSYADWYIPTYEFLGEDKMLTFQPTETGVLDEYEGIFELILLNGNEKFILGEFAQPLPLISSPNGKYCLIGYDYERLINLKDQTIQELF